MTLTGGEQGATRVDERRQQLVFFTNKKGVARGTGFLPGSQAEVWLFSTPTSLGTTSVRADGSWEIEFLVPGDVAAGQHTIQAEGTGPDGQDRALAALVAVDTDPGIARNRKVTKTMVLTFDPMSSNLNPKQEHELKRLLRGKGLYKVRTTGYVQPAGMTRNDLKLSWERAMAAAAFIDRRRLVLQTDINFSGVAKGRRAAGKDACAKVENRCTVVELVYRRG
jgi:outer membrane protein OmpA-like peptidoglycan-associated protein